MSIANTGTETIIEAGIIENNDQVQARVEHLKQLENLVGNVYPNKFERTKISGAEDTISNLVEYHPIREIVKQLKENTPAGEKPNPELKESLNAELRDFGSVRISGRLAVPPRVMGKAAFVHLSDGKNRLQIYVRRDDARAIHNSGQWSVVSGQDKEKEPTTAHRSPTTVDGWEVFKLLDHGDFIGAEGYLFLTNTGELSVHVETFQFLAKALLPMPDKMHGIADPELRRRYRYADLIASSLQVEHAENELTTREVFERRARLISGMRRYLDDHGYIEVETPMLTPKATGAAARAFETHHNALDLTLYARIAPELYLKRLTVGGFEKVYELNRNFRNEGLSHKHNPEFTMLEFYCAYMDVNGMMDFAERMIQEAVQKATGGSLQVEFDGKTIDFSNFKKVSMHDSVHNTWNETYGSLIGETLDTNWHTNVSILRKLLIFPNLLNIEINNALRGVQGFGHPPDGVVSDSFVLTIQRVEREKSKEIWERASLFEESIPSEWQAEKNGIKKAFFDLIVNELGSIDWTDSESNLKLVERYFEKYVEKHLIQPTFIIDYPKSISPLSKASPENPQIAERFELFINGMECANGFSELNDPQEQFERFIDQMKERAGGDDEAMVLDEDYIRALAYGMPPAAGIGIGIDRLVMLLTNKHSIRDVILFPHMRPLAKEEDEKKSEEEEESNL